MWWSWVLTAVGVTGFILAGQKLWWAWYINIACQVLWVWYAFDTEQYGFIVAAAIYTAVFTNNAVKWTRERPRYTVGEPGPRVHMPMRGGHVWIKQTRKPSERARPTPPRPDGAQRPLTEAEVEEFMELEVAKMLGAPGVDIEDAVRTAVADTWLVMQGVLKVEDFRR